MQACAETVASVIGVGNRFFFGRELRDGQNGSEDLTCRQRENGEEVNAASRRSVESQTNLFFDNPHRGLDVGENCELYLVPRTEHQLR